MNCRLGLQEVIRFVNLWVGDLKRSFRCFCWIDGPQPALDGFNRSCFALGCTGCRKCFFHIMRRGGRNLRKAVYLLRECGFSSKEQCTQLHCIAPLMVEGRMIGRLMCSCRQSSSSARLFARIG